MPASLTALIVDDEPLARQELKYLLDRAGDVDVIAQGANGIEAVDLIRTHQPDVVFLDVRMPGLDGFAVLRKLLTADQRIPLPQVVFATAFDQYAVKAFEVNAVDYLLKPFDSERLARTLEKVRSRVRSPETGTEPLIANPLPGPGLRTAVAPPRSPLESAPATSPTPPTRARLWEVAQTKLDTLLRMVEEQAGGLSVPARCRAGTDRSSRPPPG